MIMCVDEIGLKSPPTIINLFLFSSSPLFPLQRFLIPWESLKGFLSHKVCINPDGWCADCPHDKECNGGDNDGSE